ncbi:hypothetical protein Tco_1276290 [Tanacetum coccineum]
MVDENPICDEIIRRESCVDPSHFIVMQIHAEKAPRYPVRKLNNIGFVGCLLQIRLDVRDDRLTGSYGFVITINSNVAMLRIGVIERLLCQYGAYQLVDIFHLNAAWPKIELNFWIIQAWGMRSQETSKGEGGEMGILDSVLGPSFEVSSSEKGSCVVLQNGAYKLRRLLDAGLCKKVV